MNRNYGIDYSASEAENYGTSEGYNIDNVLKRDWLAEAIIIADGKSMMIPERRHFLAVVDRMRKLEQGIANAEKVADFALDELSRSEKQMETAEKFLAEEMEKSD